MALFIDTFVNKIDSKGRVSVPATFRAELNLQRFNGIVAMPSLKHPAIRRTRHRRGSPRVATPDSVSELVRAVAA